MRRIVSKDEAAAIAVAEALCKCPPDAIPSVINVYSVTDRRPTGAYISHREPAWFVYVPWADGDFALRSSRVIAISKVGGRMLFDGSAGDEG